MYENLKFRRQFLLSKAPITLLKSWQYLQIDKYHLYAHPDLDLHQVADTKRSITLIGSLFDSEEPKKGNIDILNDVMACTNSVDAVILQIKRYAGSYALLYKDSKDAIILHDALGLREIYYCVNDNQIICGSQPNFIMKYADPEINPTTDPDILDFYQNHLKDYSWIGDETYFEGVKHLLPNHCLDIVTRECRRYWPNQPIERLELDEAVAKSCRFMQGIIKAMEHRHPVMMAVTAGTDSRTLLAASKGIQDKIYYFINNEGIGYSHPDILISTNIFKSIKVPFHVHEISNAVENEFRRIFLSNVFFATERILPTIYNYYKNHSEKVNIVGTGEIGRTRFGKDPKNLNAHRIAYKLGYSKSRYALRQSKQILDELAPVSKTYGINVLSLVFWEQNKGNKFVVGNSESDIAIEEVNAFDSHLLYELFWGVDDKYIKNQDNILFNEIIRSMWPELLNWPINPPYSKMDKIKWFLKRINLFDSLKELQYQVEYLLHRQVLSRKSVDIEN